MTSKQSFTPTLSELTALWSRLNAIPTVNARLQHLERMVGRRWVAKNAIDIVNIYDLNPGVNTRFSLILNALEAHESQTSIRGAKKKVRKQLATLYTQSRGFLSEQDKQLREQMVIACHRSIDNAAVWKEKKETVELNPYMLDAVATLINQTIRSSNNLAPIDPITLFRQPFYAANAIEQFYEWLNGPTSKARIQANKLIIDNDLDNGQRSDCFNSIYEAIQRNQQEQDMRTINIHCPDQWMGLTAVVKTLKSKLEKEHFSLPICYISLAKNPLLQEPVDLPKVIHQLSAFYLGTSYSLTTPPSTFVAIEQSIENIRTKMLEKPALLIIDGFKQRENTLPSLTQFIRDDDTLYLLDRLTEPKIHAELTIKQWQCFHQTQLIVTSDHPLNKIKSARTGFFTQNLHSFKWPQPTSRALWLKILPLLELQHKDWIKYVYKIIPVMGQLGSEDLLLLLDCCPNIAQETALEILIKRLQNSCLSCNENDQLIPELKQQITHWIWQNHNDRPLWRIFWLFLSLSPTGLQTDTFIRVIMEWSRLSQKLGDFPHQDFYLDITQDKTTISSELTAFEQAFSGIVGRRQRDFVATLKEMDHPYEYPQPPSHYEKSALNDMPSNSLDINLLEIKSIIIELIVGKYNYDVCRFAHRLSAEECIRQQTITFRHSSEEDLASLRGYRRQLETLYHGYLSLPTAKDLGHDPFSKLDDPFSVIPYRASEAWHYLSNFGYRRIFERWDYKLSRYFGADALKLEILLLAKTPHLYREVQTAYVSDDKTNPHSSFELIDKDSSIRATINLSIAQVLHTTKITGTYEDNSNITVAELNRLPFNFFKREVDILMAKAHDATMMTTVRQSCIERIESILPELGKTLIDNILSQITALEYIFTQCNFDLEVNLRNVANITNTKAIQPKKIARKITTELANQNVQANASRVIDLLNRIAESCANEAERPYRYGLSDLSQTERQQSAEATLRSNYTTELLKAFAFLRQSEVLRLHLSKTFPDDKFEISGHSSRLFIRIALKLERNAQIIKGNRPAGYFGRTARRMTDVLCRHLFAYPRERASMLIIESSIARIFSDKDSKLDTLKLCFKFLEQAEKIIATLDIQARLRMRLRWERINVLRAMSHQYQKQDQQELADFYKSLAIFDSNAFDKLANEQEHTIWWHLTESLSEPLN